MPKQTFINLSEEKQDKFIRAALEEFAFNNYQSASISKIVKKLGIAKGSVYQYFENKKELYFYLIELGSKKKMTYIQPILIDINLGLEFWDKYEKMYAAGLRFNIENPLHSAFLYSVSQERYSEELGDLLLEQKKKGVTAFVQIFKQAIDKGQLELREDVSLFDLAYYFVQASAGIMDYLKIRYNIGIKTDIEARRIIWDLDEEVLQETARTMIKIIRSGIEK